MFHCRMIVSITIYDGRVWNIKHGNCSFAVLIPGCWWRANYSLSAYECIYQHRPGEAFYIFTTAFKNILAKK